MHSSHQDETPASLHTIKFPYEQRLSRAFNGKENIASTRTAKNDAVKMKQHTDGRAAESAVETPARSLLSPAHLHVD
jgi:hypothetical protein